MNINSASVLMQGMRYLKDMNDNLFLLIKFATLCYNDPSLLLKNHITKESNSEQCLQYKVFRKK